MKKTRGLKKWDFSILLSGFKNYFVSLKYFFTPLGALFLGLALGVSVFIPGVTGVLNIMVGDVKELASKINLNLSDIWNALVSEFLLLPLENPFELLKVLFGSDWLFATLDGILQKLVGEYEFVSGQLTVIVSSAIEGFKLYAGAFIACGILGLIAGHFLTLHLVRRNIAKRKIWMYLLFNLLEVTFAALLISLCSYLGSLMHLPVAVSLIVSLILFGFISLFEACALHSGSFALSRQILTLGNVLLLTASNLLIITAAFVFTVIIIAVTDAVFGFFVALPLIEIAFIVAAVNAEAYVKKISDRLKSAKEAAEVETDFSESPSEDGGMTAIPEEADIPANAADAGESGDAA